MKIYKITEEEKNIIEKFENSNVPYIFKSGMYGMYLQEIEICIIDICYYLKKGYKIEKNLYEMFTNDFNVDNEIQYDINNFDEDSLPFFINYLHIRKMVKKYGTC